MAYYYVSGSATIGFWRYDNGVGWIKVTTRELTFYQETGGGQVQINWDITWDLEIPRPFHYLGVSVDKFDGVGATISQIVSMIYAATSTSGERSATPGGEQVRATVRPV